MLNNDVNPKALSRVELLKLAHTLRVTDADVMTRAELRAAIERARAPEARTSAHPVSWLGKARRLLASVVERGLHLPEAATLIRGGLPVRPFPGGPPPVATVTLARIYAAQGHLVRAIGILDEVLVSDPDHELARGLREELQRALDERRERERRERERQEPASAAAAAAGQSATAEPELEEAPPSEAQLAASELLGAIPPQIAGPEVDAPEVAQVDAPEVEAPAADEITLAGTVPEAHAVEPGALPSAASEHRLDGAERTVSERAATEAGAGRAEAEAEAEAETRRRSAAPAAMADGEPEPETVARPAAEPASATPEPQPGAAQSQPASELALQPAAPDAAASNAEAPDALAAGAPASATPAAAATPGAGSPRAAGLVLIETSEPSAYVYWELAGAAPADGAGNAADPHWVCVVAHAPRGARSERREYRFPVQRAAGAVRIEGLPRHAVVRAKLTRGEAPEAAALVVAGSVRVGCTAGGCDGSALERARAGFLPHPAADPAPLALRAAAHLASAAPLYY